MKRNSLIKRETLYIGICIKKKKALMSWIKHNATWQAKKSLLPDLFEYNLRFSFPAQFFKIRCHYNYNQRLSYNSQQHFCNTWANQHAPTCQPFLLARQCKVAKFNARTLVQSSEAWCKKNSEDNIHNFLILEKDMNTSHSKSVLQIKSNGNPYLQIILNFAYSHISTLLILQYLQQSCAISVWLLLATLVQ